MQELADERAVVKRALGLLGVAVWVFEEDAGARTTTIRQTYLDALDKSDLYIGLFWKSWGKYTIDEFRHAKDKLHMDCLIYEKRAPVGQREPQLQQFLDEIGSVESESGLTIRRFADVHELDLLLQTDVPGWVGDKVRERQADKIQEQTAARLDYRFQAPPLGDRYVARPLVLKTLKTRLLPSSDGREKRVTRAVLHGPPGVGKTVIASAFAHDEEVSGAFPDGVLWLSLGEHPDLLRRLTEWARTIPDPQLAEQGYSDLEGGVGRLRSLLRDRAYLLVVDDAWTPEHIEQAFLIGGPRCLLLVTTRQERIAAKIGAEKIELAPMVEEEATELMSRWAGPISQTDAPIARQLAQEVGYLPLALELIGARVGTFGSWAAYMERWRRQRLGMLTRDRGSRGRQDSVRDSLELSLNVLSGNDRERYVRLGVFARKTLFPASAAATLWDCDLWEAADFLIDLAGQAVLFRRETEAGFRYGLHDLLYDFVLEQMGNMGVLQAHEILLAGYRDQGHGTWPSVPDDGYFFDHLSYHLIQAKRGDELIELLTGAPDWMNAKATLGTDSSLAVDVERALGLESDVIKLVKLHAVRQVIRERLGWISDTDLRTLVWRSHDTQALSQARLRPDPDGRFASLIVIYEELRSKGDPRPELLEEAEAVARGIGEGAARADALRVLGTLRLSMDDARWSSTFDDARKAANVAEGASTRWKALLGLADALRDIDIVKCREMLDAARAAAEQMTENFNRSEALPDIALAYARTGLAEDALQILETLEPGYWYRLPDMITDVLLASHRVGTLSRSLTEQAFALFDREGNTNMNATRSLSACIHALMGDREAYDAVLNTWSEEDKSWYASKARRCLVAALAAAGDFEGADREMDRIDNRRDLADALEDVVRAAGEAGYTGGDDLVSKAAPRLRPRAKREPLGEDLISHTIRVWRLLLQAGRPQEAFRLIRWLDEGDTALALNELLPELDRIDVRNRASLLEEVDQITREIQSEYCRESALRALALAFAKVRDKRADSVLEQAWAAANSRAMKTQPDRVLLGVAETFAAYSCVEVSRKILGALHNIPMRVDALCGLARFLFDRGDERYTEVLATALETGQAMTYDSDRVQALIALIDLLGHTHDPRRRSLTDEAEQLARNLPDDDLFPDKADLLFPHRRASQALANLTDCLTELKLFDEALQIAENIPDRDIRGQRRAHIAMKLSKVGDSRSDEVFDQAKAILRRSTYPGSFAENARVLMFALADAGRFDEAIEVAQIDFREEDRSNTLAAFTQTLIQAGRIEDAWEIGHSIALPSQRAEALVNLALALAQREDTRGRRLLEEVRELAQTAELPDRKASVLDELVRGLARIGELVEAEHTAETISVYDFRADAFREIADAVHATNPDRAESLLRRALTEARAIPRAEQRKRVMTTLIDTLARTQGIRRGLETLEVDSLDEFVAALVRWAPWFEKLDREFPLNALRAAITIASWIRLDWRNVPVFELD
jgi:tetratricopeptide (TPR) repeat protein